MKIAIVSSEAVPFAKTGGLADVAGTLFRTFRQMGNDVVLFLPLYRSVRAQYGRDLREIDTPFSIQLGGEEATVRLFALDKMPFDSKAGRRPAGQSGRVLFVANDAFFDREELYGTADAAYADNAQRFIFFSKAVTEAISRLGYEFDAVHCNDWQTALIPYYMKTLWRGAPAFAKTRSVFTIHNLGYQGIFPPEAMALIGLGWEYFTLHGLEFYGQVNLLKAGIAGADAITTVSPTYAAEILTAEYGFGLEGALSARRERLHGILNGIDYAEWTPYADPHLPSRYSSAHLAGKAWCRRTLVSEWKLSDGLSRPLIGFVGRLADQKGVDLIAEAIPEMIRLGANIILVGKGEARLHNALSALQDRFPGHMHLTIGFAEPHAHHVYAASDLFLMPSRYEPCGLGQMIAMRYGTIPVARRTGGLADTIDHGRTGFLFDEPTAVALTGSVREALAALRNKSSWRKLVRAAMDEDFSWTRSAQQYLDLYQVGRQ